MFGNAPRALWSQWIPPDERHRIPLSCCCLLVRDGGRNMLFEALCVSHRARRQEVVPATVMRDAGEEGRVSVDVASGFSRTSPKVRLKADATYM